MPSNAETNGVEALRFTPEGQYFDRKSARINPHDLAKTITAMANAGGGRLAIGIEDDGQITGFHYAGARTAEEFERCAQEHCDPAPLVTSERFIVNNAASAIDFVLLLSVHPSRPHIVRRKGDSKVFLRVADKSTSLTEYEVIAVMLSRKEGKVTRATLASHIGRSRHVAGLTLQDLVGKGVMQWHGTSTHDPNQYYALDHK